MDECEPLVRGVLHLAGAGARQGAPGHGRAVQVDPIIPTLKAPGTKRLQLKYDITLSSFAFNFNLRRCSMGLEFTRDALRVIFTAGAYTRPLLA